MKNICIVTPMFLPVPAVNGGAIENLITILINENEKNSGINFDIITIKDKKITNDYKNTNIVQININPILFFFQRCLNKLFHIFHLKKYFDFHTYLYNKVVSKVSKGKYDAIVIENNMQLYKKIYKRLGKKNKIPFYFHLHNDLNEQNKKKEEFEYILSTCKNFFVVSDYLKTKLNLIKKSNKIITLYNVINKNKYENYIINPNIINQTKSKFGIMPDQKVIGYVGRPDSEKGLLELVLAFNKLNMNNTKLLLISPDFTCLKYKTEYLNKLCNEIIKNNKNIIISGYIEYEQMPLYYSLIDIVVIPTICQEAFGLVALEAKTLGKKIVYTNSGALPEILKDTDAIMVEIDNNIVDNLVFSIKKAMKNIHSRELNLKIKTSTNDLQNYYNDFIKYIKQEEEGQ